LKEGFYSITDANSDFFSEMQGKSMSNTKLRNLVKGLNLGEIIEENNRNMKTSMENQETPK